MLSQVRYGIKGLLHLPFETVLSDDGFHGVELIQEFHFPLKSLGSREPHDQYGKPIAVHEILRVLLSILLVDICSLVEHSLGILNFEETPYVSQNIVMPFLKGCCHDTAGGHGFSVVYCCNQTFHRVLCSDISFLAAL